ncbi:glycosyltransferase BC10-like [Aristolochia californica]|uniref:glycosyltransferase BC10-like n=1 Tax=Aristolochia californica TaxID=171875 RepID=UPI0035E0E414
MLSPPPFFLCCLLLVFLPLSIWVSVNTKSIKFPLQLQPIFPKIKNGGSASILPFSVKAVETRARVAIRRPRLNGDGALLRRATRSNPDPILPTKVAFMFLTTVPLPFAPLWERFFARGNHTSLFNIYIHTDPSRPYPAPFDGVFASRVIPSSKPTRRGHHSLIAAARRLLAHALLDDPANAMFVLLSPSCIPLRSFPFVYRTLTDGSAKSFIEILAGEPGIEARYNARGEGSMLPAVPFESFRVGSQFFAMARRHARLVVNDTALWSRFRRPCRDGVACFPEEHYFCTLLRMRDPQGCVPATLTHVDWAGSVGGHPRMYSPEEVGPELMSELRSARPRYGEDLVWGDGVDKRWDPFLFARKFAPKCLEPLMRIADEFILEDR